MDNETKRKIIHIGNGFWVFLLPFIDRLLAIAVILIAFIYVFILARPETPGKFFQQSFSAMARADDIERGFLKGPSIYVFSVLLLVIFVDFRIAGAVFGFLAFGDGFATLVGRKYGKIKLSGSKTLEGFIAFIISGFIISLTIFILIDIFNTPIAGLDHKLLLLLPANVTYEKMLIEIIIVFLVLAIILGLVELYLANFVDDNILIPLIGTFFLLVVFQII